MTLKVLTRRVHFVGANWGEAACGILYFGLLRTNRWGKVTCERCKEDRVLPKKRVRK